MASVDRTVEIIRQKCLEVKRRDVMKAALAAINAIQTRPIAVQFLATAVLLVILLNRYSLNVTELLGIAHNMVFMSKVDKTSNDVQVLDDYINEEWSI